MGGFGPSREGPANRYEKPKKKNPIATFIKSGGVYGKVVRTVKKASKKSKQNVLDYEGQAAGKTPMRNPIRSRDRDNQNFNQGRKTVKSSTSKSSTSITQKKAVANAPAGPTAIEMNQPKYGETEAEKLLKIKKKGRKATIATSQSGLGNNVEILKKNLLGG